tara:strand:- start:1118 stop:2014 length:897 start_codon:yes stop_codon:yes gene_type:complete
MVSDKNKMSKKGKKKINADFQKANCSAGISTNDFTCYTSDTLKKMKQLWNLRHPDATIDETEDRDIWEALKDNMSDVCNSEKCWLRQKFAKYDLPKELIAYTFAPTAPKLWIKNPNEWLSSVDIEKVMHQYERKHKEFEFIGPSPIDFDKRVEDGQCVWNELCTFDLKKQLVRKKSKIGFIFNTDPHYLSGSHWVSLFVDLNKKNIFFFDSTGDDIPSEVKTLIERIVEQGREIGFEMKPLINKRAHQKGDTECGMYSLYMIITLLENKHTPNYFMTHRISDAEMEKMRHVYFNQPGL